MKGVLFLTSLGLFTVHVPLNRWINWFTLSGLEGLKSLLAGRPAVWHLSLLFTLLPFLLQHSPQDFGYLRSRWSLELITGIINEVLNLSFSKVR
ncbi:hypothetical protein MEG1DRAFT_03963 [Photorhabdus temperata subsp. temperata Meg1]|uniref:Uncharacterized protein n=1 Tax=Photorhabdus temperata subsp. temperata Meg1 TaxID=1393735 RepID=A0A081RRW6_PHOTE|nr:hypothetical protein MEG1DRAFT_03963 [Photorhabdus temperata subsp. temperata Meg1]